MTNRRCREVKTVSLIRPALVGCFALAELAPEPTPRPYQTVCGLLWLVAKRVIEAEETAAAGQKAIAVKRWERSNH